MKTLIINLRTLFWSCPKWARVLLSVPLYIIGLVLVPLLTLVELIKELPGSYKQVAEDDYAEVWLEAYEKLGGGE